MEYEIGRTLLHLASTGNRTRDLLIMSLVHYRLDFLLYSLDATYVCNVPCTSMMMMNS